MVSIELYWMFQRFHSVGFCIIILWGFLNMKDTQKSIVILACVCLDFLFCQVCQYRIPLYFSKGFYKCHCLWHLLGCHKQGVTAAEQPNFLCVYQQVLNHHSLKKQNKIKLTHFSLSHPQQSLWKSGRGWGHFLWGDLKICKTDQSSSLHGI